MNKSGEFELIAALRARFERAAAEADFEPATLVLGGGDDAAISVRGGATVTSVDALVEGVHFRIPPFAPSDVGHKALAVALSDLAAMGAAPEEAYIQLGVPDACAEQSLLELADGLGALAAQHRVAVAGGDLTRAPVLLLAITVVGSVSDPTAALRRSGARPGDAVAVTGSLGGAAAGLLLSERPELESGLGAELAAELRSRQLRPLPRIAAGQALAANGASAMIDVSDGLGGDAGHLAQASGVELMIELERLPLQRGVAELAAAAGVDPLQLAVSGGEDYELLVALPRERLEATTEAVAATGSDLTVIGEVAPGGGVTLSEPGGASRPASGFDQLHGRQAPGAPL